jgi:transcriptional regulator with XRE-family HTH domain
MDNAMFQTTEELLKSLGERIRKLRLSKDLLREDVAKKAGVSLRTLGSLEKNGRGTIETLLRVLRALGEPAPLNSVVATTPISPMALLRIGPDPKRARRHRQLS